MNERKKVRVEAELRLASKSEVLKFVPSEVYDDIKAKDERPVFAMMSVGYEGESTGNLRAKGTPWYKQLWPLAAVKELIKRIKENRYTPLFRAHDVDNPKRIAVGSLVAGAKKIIKGVTHAVGIGYISDERTKKEIKSGKLDYASLEAVCLFEEAPTLSRWIVRRVKSLKGIALGNSDETYPGFEDAKIMAVVTAMAKKGGDEPEGDDDMAITLKDVKEFVAESQVAPEALFTSEQLVKCGVVGDAIKNEVATAVKEKDEALEKLNKEMEPFRDRAHKDRVAEAVKKSALVKDEYKATVEYLVGNVMVEVPEDASKLQEVVDAAVKQKLEALKAAGFSPEDKTKAEETEPEPENKEDGKKKEAGKGTEAGKEDMTKAESNPLIPGHEAAKSAVKSE